MIITVGDSHVRNPHPPFDSSLVQAQQNDLDQISYYEIALSDERRDEQREIEDHVIQLTFHFVDDHWLILGGFRFK